jgi:hypothetical protein
MSNVMVISILRSNIKQRYYGGAVKLDRVVQFREFDGERSARVAYKDCSEGRSAVAYQKQSRN